MEKSEAFGHKKAHRMWKCDLCHSTIDGKNKSRHMNSHHKKENAIKLHIQQNIKENQDQENQDNVISEALEEELSNQLLELSSLPELNDSTLAILATPFQKPKSVTFSNDTDFTRTREGNNIFKYISWKTPNRKLYDQKWFEFLPV